MACLLNYRDLYIIIYVIKRTVPCPHIHIYKEGYNDKWAYYLDANKFKDIDDLAQVLKDFLNLLNIKHIPPIILKLGLI